MTEIVIYNAKGDYLVTLQSRVIPTRGSWLEFRIPSVRGGEARRYRGQVTDDMWIFDEANRLKGISLTVGNDSYGSYD